MKDLMANTVGTVELQQLKQKHEQKVNSTRGNAAAPRGRSTVVPALTLDINSWHVVEVVGDGSV